MELKREQNWSIKIKMILSNNNIYTVDTQDDLKMVERLMSMEID